MNRRRNVKKSSTTIGVVLGRFQIPKIHPGHKAVIEAALKLHQQIVIAIALTPVFFNRANPLPGPVRMALLRAAFPDTKRVKICYLHNNPVSNREWSKEFDRTLEKEVGKSQCVIYGGRDNSLKCYSGKHETCSLDINIPISATAVRETISKADFPKDLASLEWFAAGIIYATQQVYPTVYTAVDMALYRPASKSPNGRDQILLCRKKTDPKGKWRFPGGFADPTDETLADAAKRELWEELGAAVKIGKIRYLGDTLIDDWRYRGTEHAIRSSFHLMRYIKGNPVASDDVYQCRWFNIDRLSRVIIKAHKPLAKILVTRFQKSKG